MMGLLCDIATIPVYSLRRYTFEDSRAILPGSKNSQQLSWLRYSSNYHTKPHSMQRGSTLAQMLLFLTISRHHFLRKWKNLAVLNRERKNKKLNCPQLQESACILHLLLIAVQSVLGNSRRRLIL